MDRECAWHAARKYSAQLVIPAEGACNGLLIVTAPNIRWTRTYPAGSSYAPSVGRFHLGRGRGLDLCLERQDSPADLRHAPRGDVPPFRGFPHHFWGR